jgi:flagellar biosynthesis protein FlhG
MVKSLDAKVFDQAAGLRRMGAVQPVKVVAITGGKGGVGKTLVSVNLGAALAALGQRTMLLDADLGLANVDVVLGLHARQNLEHVINGDCTLEDVIVTASSGLRVVPASSGSLTMATLDRAQHAGLVNAFSHLFEPLDILLVDTAAGLGDSVVTFSEASQRVVVVVCDEPASLTDAYGLIKVLSRRQSGCRFEIVSNMVSGPAQGRALYDKLTRVCDRFLGLTPSYFGHVPYDDYLRQAIRSQATVVETFPSSPSARAFQRLAQALIGWTPATGARGGIEFFMERMLRSPGPGAALRPVSLVQ